MSMTSKNCLNFGTTLSFGDDTNIFFSESNTKLLYYKADQDLSNVNAWMIANKLTININNTTIEKVKSVRFLEYF